MNTLVTLAGTFFINIFEVYIDIMVLGLMIQLVRWMIDYFDNDETNRSFASYMAGAIIWPYTVFKAARELIND